MTNFEWLVEEKKDFLKELVERRERIAVEKRNGEVQLCSDIHCEECLFNIFNIECSKKTKDWLNAEHNPYSIPLNTPIDTKVLVRDNEGAEWKRRHFAGFGKDTSRPYRCYADGETSWSTDGVCLIWKYCKLASEEEKGAKE